MLPDVDMTTPIVEAEKLCHQCGEYWPKADEFFFKKRSPVDGRWLYSSPCKACREEKRRERNRTRPCCIAGCTNPRESAYTHRCKEHKWTKGDNRS